MATFSLDPHTFQALTTSNPKFTSQQTHEALFNQDQGPQQSGSTNEGTEKLCSHSAEPGQEHRNAADEQPAVDVTESTRQGSIVAIAGHDPAVLEIWSVTTGTIIQHLNQPAGCKHGMCMAVQLYMQSGQHTLHALVGYEDGTIAVWDVAAGSLLASKQLHAEPVMAAAVAADGSGGICAAADNKVQCFCLGPTSTLLTVLTTLEVKQQGIADICIRPDQRLFATAGWDGKVRLFHHKKMRPLAILQYHRKGVTALVFQPHNQCLVSASRDGTIAVWSVFQRESS